MRDLARRVGAALLAVAIAMSVATAPAGAQSAYDDATLEAFVTAALAVEQLIVAWSPRVEGAETEAQAMEYQEQAKGEIDSAIEGTEGMSVDSYMGIMQAMNDDLALRERVQQIYLRQTGQ